MGRPRPEGDRMRLAFVADTFDQHVGVALRQDDHGVIRGTVFGSHDMALVERQVRRILSLDHSGEGWAAVGARDLVIGGLQAQYPGLRPVLFHSPYEAAAWAIISQRRHRSQAAALRNRLSAELGHGFTLAGERMDAFPLPARLRDLDSFPGLDPVRTGRLRGIADAALNGQLDPDRLRAMDPETAIAGLLNLAGIGPTYANLIELRSTGVTDVLTNREPRLPAYAAHFYGLAKPLDPEQLRELAERWRPYRTWTAVLIRVAGDRAGLAPPGRF